LDRSGSAALCSSPSLCSKLPTVRPSPLGLVRSFPIPIHPVPPPHPTTYASSMPSFLPRRVHARWENDRKICAPTLLFMSCSVDCTPSSQKLWETSCVLITPRVSFSDVSIACRRQRFTIDPPTRSSSYLSTPNLYPLSPGLFLHAYTLLIHHVFSLPLLPNRLPLASLSHLSANLPLAAASVLSPSIPQIAAELGVEAKVHLLANLAAFVPPKYPSLPAASLTTLLHLMARIMSTLPTGALEPPLSVSNGKQVKISESDSDSDSG
jgi:hypothetical protein